MATPKGMRDLPPEMSILRKDVFARLERIFRRFGFDPLETPIVELWDTLKGKYGPEAENKMIYAFKDRWGGKELALRYDLTVPLARFISENPTRPLPFKRYAIGRVYRHEEPQRGRYREFYQCDVDTIGSKEPSSDAEILLVIGAVMKEFKLPGYSVQVNDRRLLAGIFEKGLGINRNLLAVYRNIDKLDKVGWATVRDELKKILPIGTVSRIKDVIDIQGGPFEVLDEVESQFGKIDEVKTASADLREIFELSKKVRTRLNLSMVRGLDYYTGPIFETIVKEPRIGSITGGGRYDELLGQYGRPFPATGTTIGVERLIDTGIALGIFKKVKSVTDVYVVDLGDQNYAWRVAKSLRGNGLNVRVDLMGRNWKKQVSESEKFGIRFIAMVGPKEAKKGVVTVIDKETDKKKIVKLLDVPKTIKILSKV
ncbi:MAG: histidine--tRNA ligase [Candidatus Altiarchaeota archaeon]|nr:histidine--tRNA ligase [Candidatus Altiarchaeota archaeon]